MPTILQQLTIRVPQSGGIILTAPPYRACFGEMPTLRLVMCLPCGLLLAAGLIAQHALMTSWEFQKMGGVFVGSLILMGCRSETSQSLVSSSLQARMPRSLGVKVQGSGFAMPFHVLRYGGVNNINPLHSHPPRNCRICSLL